MKKIFNVLLLICAITTYSAQDQGFQQSTFDPDFTHCDNPYQMPGSDGLPPAKRACLSEDTPENIFDGAPSPTQSQTNAPPSPPATTSQQWLFDYDSMPNSTFVCFNPPALETLSIDSGSLPPSPSSISSSLDEGPTDHVQEQEASTPSSCSQTPEPQSPESVALTPEENNASLTIFHDGERGLPILFHISNSNPPAFVRHLLKYGEPFLKTSMIAASYPAHDGADILLLPFRSYGKTTQIPSRKSATCDMLPQIAECLYRAGVNDFLDKDRRDVSILRWEEQEPLTHVVINNGFCALPLDKTVAWIGIIETHKSCVATTGSAIILTPQEQQGLHIECERLTHGCVPDSAIIHAHNDPRLRPMTQKTVEIQTSEHPFLSHVQYTHDVVQTLHFFKEMKPKKEQPVWCLIYQKNLVLLNNIKSMFHFANSAPGSLLDISAAFLAAAREKRPCKATITRLTDIKNLIFLDIRRLLGISSPEILFTSETYDHKREKIQEYRTYSQAGVFLCTIKNNLYFIPDELLYGSWMAILPAIDEPFLLYKMNDVASDFFARILEFPFIQELSIGQGCIIKVQEAPDMQ